MEDSVDLVLTPLIIIDCFNKDMLLAASYHSSSTILIHGGTRRKYNIVGFFFVCLFLFKKEISARVLIQINCIYT